MTEGEESNEFGDMHRLVYLLVCSLCHVVLIIAHMLCLFTVSPAFHKAKQSVYYSSEACRYSLII